MTGSRPGSGSWAGLSRRPQGNFVWLNLGANSAEFAALAGERALSVRAFGDEGVRVSIGEAEANTRFLELCAIYTKPPRRS